MATCTVTQSRGCQASVGHGPHNISLKADFDTEGGETRKSGMSLKHPSTDVSLFPSSKKSKVDVFLGVDNLLAVDNFLAAISGVVSLHKDKCVELKKPAGAILRIAGLDDTIYRGKHDEVDGWGKFYLPNIVNMKVIGVLEGTPCPCEQLVLMTCEDKKLYVYDGEELHLVASDFERLHDREIEYPASKSYYNGEAFKDMTEEDWKEVKLRVWGGNWSRSIKS